MYVRRHKLYWSHSLYFTVRTKVFGHENDAPKFYPSDSGFAEQVEQFVPIFPTNFRLIMSNKKYAPSRFSYVTSKWPMLMTKISCGNFLRPSKTYVILLMYKERNVVPCLLSVNKIDEIYSINKNISDN